MRQESGRIRQLGLLLLVSVMAIAVVSAVALASDQGEAPASRDQAGALAAPGDTRAAEAEPSEGQQRGLVSEDCPGKQLNETFVTHDGVTRELLDPEAQAARWLATTDLKVQFPNLTTEVVDRTDVTVIFAFRDASAGTVAMIGYEKDPALGWLMAGALQCS